MATLAKTQTRAGERALTTTLTALRQFLPTLHQLPLLF